MHKAEESPSVIADQRRPSHRADGLRERRSVVLAPGLERPAGVQIPILLRYPLGVADVGQLAMMEKHGPIAESGHELHVVGHENDRLTLRPELLEVGKALLLEALVTDAQYLVE